MCYSKNTFLNFSKKKKPKKRKKERNDKINNKI